MKKYLLLIFVFFCFNFNPFAEEFLNYDKPIKLIDDLYPIGWSKDGKFAYIKMQDGEPKCGYIFSFIISDMVTDKNLFELDFSDDEYTSENFIGSNQEYFDFVWGNKKKQIINKLNEFKILPVKSKLQAFPVKYNEDEFNINIDKTIVEDDLYGESIKAISLWIYSKKSGKKIIYKNKQDNTLSVNISGYILSPFEDRIAIIMIRIFPGWEGPPNIAVIDLIGCHLTKNFQ